MPSTRSETCQYGRISYWVDGTARSGIFARFYWILLDHNLSFSDESFLSFSQDYWYHNIGVPTISVGLDGYVFGEHR